MLVDTHSHLNFKVFKDDVKEVIRRSLDNDIWMINVGTNFQTSKKGIEISENQRNGVFATVGLHPINLDTGLVKIKTDELEGRNLERKFNSTEYKKLAKSPKVVAIGEIGLDYYYKPKTKKRLSIFKERQKNLLLEELKIGRDLNLPIILHCRMAHDDLIQIFFENPDVRPRRAVAHGFVGNVEQLKKYLEFGFYIGLNGIIFKRIEGINFEKNIHEIPLEKILIETDCPYLTPPPFKEQRNEPLYLRYIVQKIAQIKKITSREIVEITTKNARELFQI